MDYLPPETLLDPSARPRRPTRDRSRHEEERTIAAFERARPAVVGISSVDLATFRRDGRLVPVEIPEGTGSGFVWDTGGWIVTNWHVVANATMVRVSLADGGVREGVLVGAVPEQDLAVIKIDPAGLDLTAIPSATARDSAWAGSSRSQPVRPRGEPEQGRRLGLERVIDLETDVRASSRRTPSTPGTLGRPARPGREADGATPRSAAARASVRVSRSPPSV